MQAPLTTPGASNASEFLAEANGLEACNFGDNRGNHPASLVASLDGSPCTAVRLLCEDLPEVADAGEGIT